MERNGKYKRLNDRVGAGDNQVRNLYHPKAPITSINLKNDTPCISETCVNSLFKIEEEELAVGCISLRKTPSISPYKSFGPFRETYRKGKTK